MCGLLRAICKGIFMQSSRHYIILWWGRRIIYFNIAHFRQTLLNHWHCVWKSHKKSHSTLRRAKRATFTYWVDQSSLKILKMVHWEPEAIGQTVLPDRSLLIRQKLVKNAKIQMRFQFWFRFVGAVLKKKANAVFWQKKKWDLSWECQHLFFSSETSLVWLPYMWKVELFFLKSRASKCKRTWESMIWLFLLWMLEEASLQRCTFLLGFYNFLFLLSKISWE